MVADPDGTTRWEALVIEYRGYYYPSLAVQAARLAMGVPDSGVKLDFGHALAMGAVALRAKVPLISLVGAALRSGEACKPAVFCLQFLFGGFKGRDARDMLVCHSRDLHARRFEQSFLLLELGPSFGERGLGLAQPRVRALELEPLSLGRGLRLCEFLLATRHRAFALFDLELARAQRRLALGNLTSSSA